MKRLVLCFDGTWNKPADEGLPPEERVETNVRRFYESVHPRDPAGIDQVKWYNPGVGTEWWNRVAGGALGAGLELHVVEGYSALADNYEPGDEVYVLGFSRGAYTARSLVGMIRNCGLVRRGRWMRGRVDMAYGIYRTRDDGVDSATARGFRAAFSHEIPIKFVGVWDTVGALGIPLGIARDFNHRFYEFHDTKLSSIVENAFHALALDEHREDYQACLWDPAQAPAAGQTVEQRWFCGAHSDVGGGYDGRGLSDLALRWMQGKAAATGLSLDPVPVGPNNYTGAMTDSYAHFLAGAYQLAHPNRFYRRVLCTGFGCEVIDDSVDLRRRGVAGYQPPNQVLPPLPPGP